jgi:hypothetical protein
VLGGSPHSPASADCSLLDLGALLPLVLALLCEPPPDSPAKLCLLWELQIGARVGEWGAKYGV